MATHTPQRSPARPSATITQVQKQALIDNLQLESRHLRVFPALQLIANENASCSHRPSAQTTSAICSAITGLACAPRATREPYTAGAAEEKRSRTDRRTPRQVQACSSSSSIGRIETAGRARRFTTAGTSNQAEEVNFVRYSVVTLIDTV